MDIGFSDVEFPLLFSDYSVGFVGVFIPLYAAAYLIFKRIKYKLPYFRRIKIKSIGIDPSVDEHAWPENG